MRNSFGFRPLAEERGLPGDASDGVRAEVTAYGGPEDVHGTTWITWAELSAADWDEADGSGARSRRTVAGDSTHWGPVWQAMRTLGGLHGAENVRSSSGSTDHGDTGNGTATDATEAASQKEWSASQTRCVGPDSVLRLRRSPPPSP
ncbi:hypothetical protein ACFVYF_37210 [Streptomyces sp. NPDC058274]|uniref:hypothetical protein n=1 Tax=Streptomyces sp. NPDC058274 TaxID=3346416 RepID=UPI0036EEA419